MSLFTDVQHYHEATRHSEQRDSIESGQTLVETIICPDVAEEERTSTLMEWEQEERGREVIQEVGPLKSLSKGDRAMCERVMCPVPEVREDLEKRLLSTSTISPGELGVKAFEIVDRVKRGSGSHLERWKRYDSWRAKIRA